ncbi:MAG: class I SAM-dependent methyltransferase [Coriobacteriia bacterium]|nr:class I SAM-dependent methyltransferase [Coriobacteriia bacterium]
MSSSVNKLRSIAVNATRPVNFGVMAQKVWLRVADHVSSKERERAAEWCADHAESAESFARDLDDALWEEALAFGADLRARGMRTIQGLGVELGGGGHYSILYFLTRLLRPSAVLETGVAAGFSSAAILEALERNNHGELFSSDFPYFRLEHPEQYVGVVVDERLRSRWHLYLNGDRQNLPVILQGIGNDVPLVHYDSDKSPSGKRYFVRHVADKLSWRGERAFWVIDDINDDLFFAELVGRRNLRHHVFAFEGKYLGVIEL